MKKIYPPRHTVGIAISKKQLDRLKTEAKAKMISVSALLRLILAERYSK